MTSRSRSRSKSRGSRRIRKRCARGTHRNKSTGACEEPSSRKCERELAQLRAQINKMFPQIDSIVNRVEKKVNSMGKRGYKKD